MHDEARWRHLRRLGGVPADHRGDQAMPIGGLYRRADSDAYCAAATVASSSGPGAPGGPPWPGFKETPDDA